jgi:hypothetical protein
MVDRLCSHALRGSIMLASLDTSPILARACPPARPAHQLEKAKHSLSLSARSLHSLSVPHHGRGELRAHSHRQPSFFLSTPSSVSAFISTHARLLSVHYLAPSPGHARMPPLPSRPSSPLHHHYFPFSQCLCASQPRQLLPRVALPP